MSEGILMYFQLGSPCLQDSKQAEKQLGSGSNLKGTILRWTPYLYLSAGIQFNTAATRGAESLLHWGTGSKLCPQLNTILAADVSIIIGDANADIVQEEP